ncbi:MAG: hypothetical protein J1F25_03850, partial [Prevotellaceae bacterium]|nr:hypothetical protein [Prevotellaceae bacterium]
MKNLKYIISLMLVACFAITSCSDPDIDLPAADDDELSSPFENSPEGPSLGITITLDDMGGRAADPNDPLWEYENYVDLEKIRVLFFDSKDDFLFESRSRWVKQIEHSYNNSRWYMSVPFFTYGDEEDWDWERIKKAMTSGPFKIAILANRPAWEWAPNFDNNTGLSAHWFDN